MDQLEQRIRRSSTLKRNSTFRELLAYAGLVRDQDQVYAFMEENKIGVDEPEFWVARLNLLRNRCQYSQLVKLIKTINRNHQLRKHPKYWLITESQNQLQNYLQKMLRKKMKGKRSAREYELLNFGDIQKETRKFGKIQVYVDPDCRKQYRLEDLVSFVTTRLKDDCEMERNFYFREISDKPLSFIGKAKEKMDKITLEAFKSSIKSDDNAGRKTNSRLSIVGRKSNKQQCQIMQTPDFKRKSPQKQSPKKHNLTIDSVQLLKNLHHHHPHRPSCQQSACNPQLNTSQISSVKKQKMRNSPNSPTKSQSFISTPDIDDHHDFIFSFAVEKATQNQLSDQKCQGRKSRSICLEIGKAKPKDKEGKDCLNDYAFMEESKSQGLGIQRKITSKDQVDLENAIKQIQMQKYESQTFSQIDSNKQNNILLCEQQSNPNPTNRPTNKDRKKFQTIKKSKEPQNEDHQDSNYKKNQNQNQNEKYERNQQHSYSSQHEDQSSQIVYQELLECLEGDNRYQTSGKQRKRISRISEERSYSFSETRSRGRVNH